MTHVRKRSSARVQFLLVGLVVVAIVTTIQCNRVHSQQLQPAQSVRRAPLGHNHTRAEVLRRCVLSADLPRPALQPCGLAYDRSWLWVTLPKVRFSYPKFHPRIPSVCLLSFCPRVCYSAGGKHVDAACPQGRIS